VTSVPSFEFNTWEARSLVFEEGVAFLLPGCRLLLSVFHYLYRGALNRGRTGNWGTEATSALAFREETMKSKKQSKRTKGLKAGKNLGTQKAL
jgi:hypothetical protein